MSAVTAPGQQSVRHIPGKLFADAAARADARALMFGLKVRLIVDIAEAQRPGIEAVFIRRRRRGNHPAVELRVVAHRHVKPAAAGEHPALLQHRVVVAGHFIATDVDAARSRAGTKGVPHAAADAVLLAVVVVAVLRAGYRQVTPDIRYHGIAAHLRPGNRRVAPGGDGHAVTRIHRGLVLPGAVALLMPLAAVGVRRDADARPTGADTHADTKAAAAAAVFTRCLLRVLRGNQVHVPGRIQRHVLPGLNLAPRHGDVASGGFYCDVIARAQGAARRRLTLHMG